MKKKGLLVIASAVLIWFAVAEVAQAASASDPLEISATVSNTCTVSAGSIAFGTYDTLSASPTDNTGTVTITCTSGAPVTIELNRGLNASVTQRRMTDTGTNYINYNLFQNAGMTTPWGPLADGEQKSATGTGVADAHTVYGRIPALQNVPAGSYADTVTAQVNF